MFAEVINIPAAYMAMERSELKTALSRRGSRFHPSAQAGQSGRAIRKLTVQQRQVLAQFFHREMIWVTELAELIALELHLTRG